jgi:hypothetical protein
MNSRLSSAGRPAEGSDDRWITHSSPLGPSCARLSAPTLAYPFHVQTHSEPRCPFQLWTTIYAFTAVGVFRIATLLVDLLRLFIRGLTPALAFHADFGVDHEFENDPERVNEAEDRSLVLSRERWRWLLAVHSDFAADRAPAITFQLTHDFSPFRQVRKPTANALVAG